MVLPVAFALMAAGGYNKYKKDKLAESEHEEDRAARREERDFQRGERQRITGMRRDLADAATPVAVEQNLVRGPEMDDRDVGTPGAVLQPDGYRVGNARMADRGQADAMAASQNAEGARMMRMTGALEKHGEFDKAASMRTSARQAKVADLQLDEMQQQKITREYDRNLMKAGDTHDALAAFISNSKGDGQGGKVKTTAVVSQDGKTTTYHTVEADGSTKATPHTFANTPEGVLQAKFLMSQGIEPKEKLAHILGEAKTAEEKRRYEADFGLRKEVATASMKNDAARTGMVAAQLGLAKNADARSAAAAEAEAKLPPAVKLAYGPMAKELDTIGGAIAKAQADGTWAPASPGAQQLLVRQRELTTQAQQMLAPYMGKGGAPAANADPLGLLAAPAPGAAPGAKVPPQPRAAGATIQAPVSPLAAAQAELQRWGSVQRARDPQGFAAAQQRVLELQQAEPPAPPGMVPAGSDRAAFGRYAQP